MILPLQVQRKYPKHLSTCNRWWCVHTPWADDHQMITVHRVSKHLTGSFSLFKHIIYSKVSPPIPFGYFCFDIVFLFWPLKRVYLSETNNSITLSCFLISSLFLIWSFCFCTFPITLLFPLRAQLLKKPFIRLQGLFAHFQPFDSVAFHCSQASKDAFL